MRIVRRLAIALTIIVGALALISAVGTYREKQLLHVLTDRDPVQDARTALAAGDSRFVGGDFGWGVNTPGVPEPSSPQLHAHGVRVLSHMGDVVRSQLDARVRDAFPHYAKQYNATILAAPANHP